MPSARVLGGGGTLRSPGSTSETRRASTSSPSGDARSLHDERDARGRRRGRRCGGPTSLAPEPPQWWRRCAGEDAVVVCAECRTMNLDDTFVAGRIVELSPGADAAGQPCD
jgi:hypothetical protein